jgi:hypothetical protein
MEHTIEHYLMSLVGLTPPYQEFELTAGDQTILTSIARQVARGTALTDRQYELVKSKLIDYRDQFERNSMVHLDLALETLNQPLRSIDRSQTITVEDGHVVVKFPFNKKTISQLDTVATKYRHFYSHEKGSNQHRFKLYEPAINEVVELFKNKQFDIDPKLTEINNQIEEIKTQELKYIPHVTVDGLVNVDPRAEELAVNEIGEFSRENRIKYWDRSVRYGYRKQQRYFDVASPLAENLANRSSVKEYINPSAYTLTDVVEALKELDRFPLLITLSRKNEYAELQRLTEAFDFVDVEQQIVLDRIEDDHDPNFKLNSFIKLKNFNRWLDSSIKIVYIFKSSLPKLLLKSEWRPIAHLSLSGERENTMTSSYIDQHCDLNIFHDAQPSYWNNTMSRQLIQWV